MRILGLDLGTDTGWAYGDEKNVLRAGTVKLATAKEITAFRKLRMDRRLDPRIPALFNWLKSFTTLDGVDWITFEDVQFSTYTQQQQLWSSFRGALWAFAAQARIDVECINVKTLKKFGSGHGGASKGGMAAGLQEPEFIRVKDGVLFNGKILNDDAVDAVHLLKWGQTILQNLTPKNT